MKYNCNAEMVYKMQTYETLLYNEELLWPGKFVHVRYVHHLVHLINAFLARLTRIAY